MPPLFAHRRSPSCGYFSYILSFFKITQLLAHFVHIVYKYKDLRHNLIQLRRNHIADFQPGKRIRKLIILVGRDVGLLCRIDDFFRQRAFSGCKDFRCLFSRFVGKRDRCFGLIVFFFVPPSPPCPPVMPLHQKNTGEPSRAMPTGTACSSEGNLPQNPPFPPGFRC